MKNNVDKKFDTEFIALQSTLHWLPWVGKNYANLPQGKKLLIVGESHYVPEGENVEDYDDDSEWTRKLICKEGLKLPPYYIGNPINPLIKNTEGAIFWDNNPTDKNKQKLWHSVSFYNFVQSLMTGKGQRPNEDDLRKGWDTFFKLIEILQPDYALFCGVAASGAYSFNESLVKYNYKCDGMNKGVKIGRTFPRTSVISNDKGYTLPLISIQHPSSYFSVDAWAKFLFSQMPEYLKWVCNEE